MPNLFAAFFFSLHAKLINKQSGKPSEVLTFGWKSFCRMFLAENNNAVVEMQNKGFFKSVL